MRFTDFIQSYTLCEILSTDALFLEFHTLCEIKENMDAYKVQEGVLFKVQSPFFREISR